MLNKGDEDLGTLFRRHPLRLAVSLIVASLVVKFGTGPLADWLGLAGDDRVLMEQAFNVVAIVGFIIGLALLLRAILYRDHNRPD